MKDLWLGITRPAVLLLHLGAHDGRGDSVRCDDTLTGFTPEDPLRHVRAHW